MNKIEKLISKMCPNGVPMVKLGDVCNISNGATPKRSKKEYWKNGDIPWFTIEDIREQGRIIKYTKQKITKSGLNSSNVKLLPKKTVLLCCTASVGEFAFTDIELTTNQQFNGLVIKKEFEERLLPEFLFCVSSKFKAELEKISGKACFNFVSVGILKQKIEIPLPPLEIQNEIVKILDKFEELEKELEKELEARIKQYEYYRNTLLTFSRERELSEIGIVVRGQGLPKKDFTKSGVGCIHYGQIYTHYDTFTYETKSFTSKSIATKLRKANTGDIILTTTSEDVEGLCKAVAWLGNEEIAIGGHSMVFKHSQNPKYLSYYFQTPSFLKQKWKYLKSGKVVEILPKDFLKIKVSIPSINRQNQVVEILDKFETLVNDISIGLPAELNKRRLQYEYYRDKLLTFKEYAN